MTSLINFFLKISNVFNDFFILRKSKKLHFSILHIKSDLKTFNNSNARSLSNYFLLEGVSKTSCITIEFCDKLCHTSKYNKSKNIRYRVKKNRLKI